MGAFGLGLGIVKTIGGVVTGDGEMIAKGLKKTAINIVTTTVDIVAGEFINNANKDSDNDIG
jgi:hypothetical protein